MPRTISDVNLFDTANNSEVYFCAILWSYFCVFSEKLILNFFSLCSGITCCWGALKPILHLGKVPPKQRSHVLYPVQWKQFWVDSLIFFPEFGVRYFESFHRNGIVFDIIQDICCCVVSINENVFCCGKKHFHIFCVVWFFFLFMTFLLLLKVKFMVLLAVIDMYRPDGAGGDTDNIKLVLYLCFICFIF